MFADHMKYVIEETMRQFHGSKTHSGITIVDLFCMGKLIVARSALYVWSGLNLIVCKLLSPT